MNERLTIISNAIYDNDFINLVRPNYQNYLDGQSKIPYYIHPGEDYQQVGRTNNQKTLDSSFYKEFIVNIFNRIDNLIDIDFEIWDHNNGSLIDIYAIEYVPYDPVIGTAYLLDGWVDIEFRVLDDVRENYITIVHEIGHALGLDHPDGDGFNSNYDIQDTIMSYNDNPSLEDIWFSDADIYTLQRIYGLEEVNNNNGSASFSISGIAVVGNTLSISEDSADPDGNGTLSYSWQTSSDDSNWTVAGTNSTYTVEASEEGKSIRAVISYVDAQGFNETVTTSISSIPFVDDGDASFSISGIAVVGNTLSISEDSADPDGNGTLSYSWQTSSDDSNWTVAGTNSTYTVEASEEGKSIRAVISYVDAQGFNETVTTSISSIPFVDDGDASFSISGIAAVGNTLSISEDSADPDGNGTLSYSWQTSSDGNNWNNVGTNSTYIVEASEEGKSIRAVISYVDAQGFNETVTTSISSIPFVDDGDASFSISGIAAVGNTLSISEDSADPDGNGTLSYSWQTSSDGNNWNNVGTNSTYIVEASEEGKSIRAVLSYVDAQGFSEVVNAGTSNIQITFPSINGPSGISGGEISTISIKENTSTIFNFSSDEFVTWSISGGLDQSLFSINSLNGALLFISSPNYESPSDSNADNKYIVDVKATDFIGNSSEQTVIISINDVIDTVPVIPNSLTVKQNFGSSSNDIISTNWDELVWGLDGDDTFNLPTYLNSDIDIEPILIGGAGNDIYKINKNQGALIYEAPNQGNNDRLILNDFSIESSDFYYVFLDEEHILFGNNSNDQFVLILDALDFLNDPYQLGIESIQLDDELYDAKNLIRSLYNQNFNYRGYLGSYSFSYFDELLGGLASKEGWTSSNLRSLISEIDRNEANFIPNNVDIWNYLASNSDLIKAFGSDIDAARNHYLLNGSREKRVADNFDEWTYLASNPELIELLGSDIVNATKHYVTNGYSEGRSLDSFSATNYLAKYSDLSAAFGDDQTLALKHYIEYGYAEGRTDTSSSSTSGSSSNLTDLEAYNYIASNTDLISSIGIDIEAAKSHYTNYGISEGRSLDSFSATNYLAKYSDLSAAFGSDQTLALKHYIEYGFNEGRTDTSSSSVSGSSSGSSSNLTDFEALNYIASYEDLINAFGIDITSAKSHYANYGKSEGRTLDDFDEWGYLASNNDLINSLGSDTTEAVKHYISFGYSQGKITNSFDAQSYLNNYADLRNAFGDNQSLATKHYVEYGFHEGRII